MSLEARQKLADDRIDQIKLLLKSNGSPAEVAKLLEHHYLDISRECMIGLTPRTDLRDHWFDISRAFTAAGNRIKKVEGGC